MRRGQFAKDGQGNVCKRREILYALEGLRNRPRLQQVYSSIRFVTILKFFTCLGAPIYIERGCAHNVPGLVVSKVEPSVGGVQHFRCSTDLCNGKETSLLVEHSDPISNNTSSSGLSPRSDNSKNLLDF